MIAMTMKEEANLDFSPNPWMPNAKIVGNITDMKKKLKKRATTEIQPTFQTITAMRRAFTIA